MAQVGFKMWATNWFSGDFLENGQNDKLCVFEFSKNTGVEKFFKK